MLLGDMLAYIDIYSVLLLLGILSHVTTILFIVKQAAARALQLAIVLHDGWRRLDLRHRREGGARRRKRLIDRAKNDEDGFVAIGGVAWA